MNPKGIGAERIILIFLVLAISLAAGWYGEKAVEKFIIGNNSADIQNF